MLSKLLDCFEADDDSTGDAAAPASNATTTTPADNRSMLKHSGMYCDFLIILHMNNGTGIYTGENNYKDGDQFFICERETFSCI